jgi:hypothetical protein
MLFAIKIPASSGTWGWGLAPMIPKVSSTEQFLWVILVIKIKIFDIFLILISPLIQYL